MMAYKLYSDRDTFHREYPASASLSDIMAAEGISGRARITSDYSDTKQYRVDVSGFRFEIREIQQ